MQGREHKRSYLKQIKVGGETYSFIAVDACLEPGPKRPFNFIGVLSLNDTKEIVSLAEQARRDGGNYTVWFGHYPTSCIVSMETGSWGIRKLIGQYEEGIVYMCGHLHKLGGMVPRMYTLQQDGFLELELGDWKASRMLVSFVKKIFIILIIFPVIVINQVSFGCFRPRSLLVR